MTILLTRSSSHFGVNISWSFPRIRKSSSTVEDQWWPEKMCQNWETVYKDASACCEAHFLMIETSRCPALLQECWQAPASRASSKARERQALQKKGLPGFLIKRPLQVLASYWQNADTITVHKPPKVVGTIKKDIMWQYFSTMLRMHPILKNISHHYGLVLKNLPNVGLLGLV